MLKVRGFLNFLIYIIVFFKFISNLFWFYLNKISLKNVLNPLCFTYLWFCLPKSFSIFKHLWWSSKRCIVFSTTLMIRSGCTRSFSTNLCKKNHDYLGMPIITIMHSGYRGYQNQDFVLFSNFVMVFSLLSGVDALTASRQTCARKIMIT